MTATFDSALVLFPGAIGDACCFLPALAGLRRKHTGRLCLVAQPAFLELLAWNGITTVSMARRAIADLFGSGVGVAAQTKALFAGFDHVYSWTGYKDTTFAQRLAAVTGGVVAMHHFRGMRPGEHAVDYYARCAAVRPVALDPAIVADDPAWFAQFAACRGVQEGGFLLMQPGSGARAKNWEGFAAVAERWRRCHRTPIVAVLGPAERERPTSPMAPAITMDDLSLAQVAALLRRCRAYLGNDSGISHVAGLVGAGGVVVFGPTDPTLWAPRSKALKILHTPNACPQCGPVRFCTHRLAVAPVFAALEEVAASAEA